MSEVSRSKLYRDKLRKLMGDKPYKQMVNEKKKQQRLKAKEKSKDISIDLKPIDKQIQLLTKEIEKIKIQQQNIKIVEQKANQVVAKPTGNGTIQSLSVKYDNKVLSESSIKNYIDKFKKIHFIYFQSDIENSIINELQKMLQNKQFNQGVINNLSWLKQIDKIVGMIKKKYTNENTIASYLNALTSILSRIPHFKEQYDYIAPINIEYNQKYVKKREQNTATEEKLNNLLPITEDWINKTVNSIKNISDKALVGVYLLNPPRRIQDYSLMKITNELNLDKLDKDYNYLILEKNKPSFFVFNNHKTKKSFPQQKITIKDKLVKILDEYIKKNDLKQNNYLFGKSDNDYIEPFTQTGFTEKLQDLFLKYTGYKNVSVDILRTSYLTFVQSLNLSLQDRKAIAHEMAHSLGTSLQYSKHVGMNKLKEAGAVIKPDVPEPEPVKKYNMRSRKHINYNEED